MRYLSSPQTDLRVAQICLGTAEFGLKAGRDETFRLLDTCVSGGGLADRTEALGSASGLGFQPPTCFTQLPVDPSAASAMRRFPYQPAVRAGRAMGQDEAAEHQIGTFHTCLDPDTIPAALEGGHPLDGRVVVALRDLQAAFQAGPPVGEPSRSASDVAVALRPVLHGCPLREKRGG
jgi:hypothetical protein